MRTFLSAVLVFAFTVAGGLALAAHTTAHVLLNPGRAADAAGKVADELVDSSLVADAATGLLDDPRLADRVRSRLDADPALRRDITTVLAEGDQVDTAAARKQVAEALAGAGYPDLARKVRRGDVPDLATGAESLGSLRAAARDRVAGWQVTVARFAGWAAAVAAGCAAAGIAVARARRNVARGVANTVIGATALTVAVFVLVPWLLGKLSSAAVWSTIVDAMAATSRDVAGPLIGVLLMGVVLRVVAPFLPDPAAGRSRAAKPIPAAGDAVAVQPARFGAGPDSRGLRSGMPVAETHPHLADPHGSHTTADARHR